MKTATFRASFYLVLSLILVLLLASCSQGDPVSPSGDPAVVQQQVQNGGWRITSMIDSGKDETAHFNGYVFSFEANGQLQAARGSTTYTGSWRVTNSNSQDDSPGDVDFTIQFNLTNAFEDLNEDWHIVSQSGTRLELIHVSGGNGGTDYLTFEKLP